MLLAGAGVTVAAVFTSGGSGQTGSGDARRAPAPTTTPAPGAQRPPSPALAPYYRQRIDWQPCGEVEECATLTVPLDYRRPGGDTIGIAVLRVPAADPSERLGSLVVNPGGPGAPGTSYAAGGTGVFTQPVLDHYDVVGFDPRGTGASEPVDCLSDEDLDTFLAQDPDPDTAGEADDLVSGIETFFQGCVDRSGPIVGHVSTVETARDVDVLRSALGESALDYLGASYGTKLGATYADLFPARVGRMVLDGAVDVSLSSRELSLGQAAGFETALRAYVEDCIGADDCPLGESLDEGLQRIKDFLVEVDGEPLAGMGDRELTEGRAFYGMILPLYVRDYWDLLTQAFEAAFDGDGSILLRLSDAYASRDVDGSYVDNSAEAIYAINCLDDPYAVTADQVPAQVPAFERASPTLGRAFAWSLVSCDGIQVSASEPAPDITAAGAAPILVVGTTRDPATPYVWAQALADQLASGVLLTRDGDGHTGYNSGNDCVDSVVEGYLVDGTVPEDDTTC
ncbi:MAG: alpha/beta fold hydrolase [Actinobacteria bacterium]|nr:alpha/beta fold hydrolase [Actinomycetota bacterium]